MLGSPHRTEPSRAGFGFGASLNSPFDIKMLSVTVGLMRLLQQTRLCLFAMNRHDPSKFHDCSPNRHDPPKLHDCTEQS